MSNPNIANQNPVTVPAASKPSFADALVGAIKQTRDSHVALIRHDGFDGANVEDQSYVAATFAGAVKRGAKASKDAAALEKARRMLGLI